MILRQHIQHDHVQRLLLWKWIPVHWYLPELCSIDSGHHKVSFIFFFFKNPITFVTGSNLLKQFVKYELYIKLLSFSLTKCTVVKCVLSTNFRDNPCIIELNYMYMHVEDREFNQLIHAFVLSQGSSGLDGNVHVI